MKNKQTFRLPWKLICLVLTVLSLNLKAQVNQTYVIEGKTNTFDKVTVSYRLNGKTIENTARIVNGILRISGKIGIKTQAMFTVFPKETVKSEQAGTGPMAKGLQFWLEPGSIMVNNIDSANTTFSGTTLNNDEIALKKQLRDSNVRFEEWTSNNGDYLKDTSAAFKKRFYEEAERSDREKKIIIIRFIKSHPTSLVSLNQLDYSLSRGVPDVTVVEPLFNGLSAAIKNSPHGKDYKQKLAGWKHVGIGSFAPDFTQPDQTGKQVKLADFKGKYVLIDFWASWCHPCRDGHPNLIKQYNLYKNKNFTIISLSLDGGGFGNKAEWLKAIEEDHISDWTQVCDLTGSGKENKVKALYGVGSIPENFLIDPDGKIIGKSLHGEEFNNKLKEIFSGNFKTGNNTNGNTSIPADVKYVMANGNSVNPPVAQTTASGMKVMTAASATRIEGDKGNYTDNDVLPLDTAVRTGKLANGFTYYIRKNKEPQNRVYFYLANKVGSILENDNQQGLAHFMEHMNFNGTKHFPKNDLVDYLQKAGVRFGADINAYTGFDETVYQLPLPSDKPDVVNNGIEIMHDWAQGALLDPAEIDKERGVILEEERLHKGAGDRIQKKIRPLLFNMSRYNNRIPIGIDTVLKNFKAETIKDFYKDWYRPNLQALIVVGDIDAGQMEKRIKEKFADLKNPENEKERTRYSIPLTGKNQFLKLTDKELNRTMVQVYFKHQEPAFKTAADYKMYLIRELFNKMLGNRFGELGDSRNNPPFFNAGGGIGSFLSNIDQYSMSAAAKPGELEKSFKAIWYTAEQVKRFGFTSTELERAKQAIISARETAVTEKDKSFSEGMVNEYVQHFLKGIPAPGVVAELQLSRQYLPLITLDDLLKLSTGYIKDTDRDIIVMGPETDAATLPDEKQVEQWIGEVKAGQVLPYKDKFVEKPLMDKLLVPGKVKAEKQFPAIKATEWILSNGIKVIVKPTGFEADNVSFHAFAPGGNSIFADKDYPSVSYLPTVVTTSGIGEYSYAELNQFLSGKNLNFGMGMDNYGASFLGFSSVKYLENMLQIIHLYFTRPKYDQKVFEGLVASLKASVKKEVTDPQEIFQDTVTSVIFGNNIRNKRLTLPQIEKMDLNTIAQAHKKQFSNAANFTFVFDGNINLPKLKVLVERYIASLPDAGEHLEARNLGMHPPAGSVTKTVYKGSEIKSEVNLTFSGAYDFNALNNKLLDALKEIIQIRVITRLREQESGVYSPNVFASYSKIPEQRYRMRIGFGCAPDRVEKLIASALDEVNKIKENGPDEIDIEKYKAEDRLGHELSLKSNDGWLNYLEEQLKNHESLNEINDYESTMQKVNKENIRAAANKYLSGVNFIKLILLPEKAID